MASSGGTTERSGRVLVVGEREVGGGAEGTIGRERREPRSPVG